MIWYGIQKGSVYGIFKQGLALINKALPDHEIFNFDPRKKSFAEELERMADQWSAVQSAKKGCNPSKGTDTFLWIHLIISFSWSFIWCVFIFFSLSGTILAGDGLVAAITKPTDEDMGELDVGAYRNRKGCWALIVQAFCGKVGGSVKTHRGPAGVLCRVQYHLILISYHSPCRVMLFEYLWVLSFILWVLSFIFSTKCHRLNLRPWVTKVPFPHSIMTFHYKLLLMIFLQMHLGDFGTSK